MDETVTTVVNFLLTRMTFIPCRSKLMVTSKFPHATRTSNREMWQKLKSKYSTQILAMEMQVPPQETHMEKERERERERGMGCPILQKCKLGKQESYKCKAPTVTLVY
jgi:hypothetical protein